MKQSFFSARRLQNILFFTLITGACLSQSACSKSNAGGSGGTTGTSSTAKDLTGFSFTKAANGTPVDATGSISGNAVTIFLPVGTGKTALNASFTISDKSTATVAGTVQASGSSANNFTSPVIYTITAQDGSKKDYTVTLVTDMDGIDKVVASFMSTYNVPGLAIAITKDENLVYVKSYGKSDDTHAAANTDLYRLASVSKQLTSIAIMKLLDQGKITLDQKVFGTGSILGTMYGTQPYSANITSITVSQLLHHTAGGWPNDGNDPMFTNPTMTAGQLISWTLDNRPLTTMPGSTYAYSNFGFCILGRVIEKITGTSYAAAVQQLVLQPSGVTDMLISGNTLADRVPNEVKYYGQGGENPYIYNIARMDAHGGWLASATDLARVLVRVDGFSGKADILSSNAITLMTTASAANAQYACGWSVNSAGNWWHQGSLPGSATEQARLSSNGKFNFVILTNTRSLSADFSGALDQVFWTGLANTAAWPGYDLF